MKWLRIAYLISLISMAYPAVGWAQSFQSQQVQHMLDQVGQTLGKKLLFEQSVRERGSFRTTTYSFRIGANVYRLVTDSEGQMNLGVMQPGSLVASSLWSGKATSTSVERLVELIFGFEGITPGSNHAADAKEQKIQERRQLGQALKWNELMNRALHGDSGSVGGPSSSGSEASMDQALSMAKMMNSCVAGGQGGSSPQRAAVENLAQIMAIQTTMGVGTSQENGEGFLSRSRQYEKQGSYSFLKQLESFQGPSPNQLISMIAKSKVDFAQLFFESLGKPMQENDPWTLAANRNFQMLMDNMGRKKTQALLEKAVGQMVVNVDHFVRLDRFFHDQLVVVDVRNKKIYVNPTINTPEQARYAVSLAMIYVDRASHALLRQQQLKYKKSSKSADSTSSNAQGLILFQRFQELEAGIAHP